MRLLLIIGWCLFAPPLLATTRYVSYEGSNTRPFDTWATAATHPDSLNAVMAAGDTAYFGASTWYNVCLKPPRGGTSSTDRTVYACSTMSSDTWLTAVLVGAEQVTGTWTNVSGNIWVINYAPSKNATYTWNSRNDYIFCVTQDGDLMRPRCVLNNGETQWWGGTSSLYVSQAGDQFYKPTVDSLYVWCYDNANPNSETIYANGKPVIQCGYNDQDYITFYGLDLKHGGRSVAELGSSDGGGGDYYQFIHCNLSFASAINANNPSLVYHGNPGIVGTPENWSEHNLFSNCTFGYIRGDNILTHGGAGIGSYSMKYTLIDSCTFNGTIVSSGVGFKNGGYADDDSIAYRNIIRYCTFDGGEQSARYSGGMLESAIWYGEKSQMCSTSFCYFKDIVGTCLRIEGSDVVNAFRAKVHGRNYFGNNTMLRSNSGLHMGRYQDTSYNVYQYNIFYDYVVGNTDLPGWVYFSGGETPALEDRITIDYNYWNDPSTSFNVTCDGGTGNWSRFTSTCGFEANGSNSTPSGFNTTTGQNTTQALPSPLDYGFATATVYGAWQPEADIDYPNPLHTALDSTSTTDDLSMYLCGMDDVASTDGDTLVIHNGWKVLIWSGAVDEAVNVKQYDSTIKLVLYNSIDHGLRSVSTAIDTSDPGNTWNTTADEYSHYKKICNDSSKSYNSLFYHFAEDTKILLYERTTGGYTYHDTVFFPAATLPISDDDSSSILPDAYSSPYFTSYGTLDTITVDTVTTHIYRRFNYQGTPQGSKVTRVYLDFSNPLARYCERSYSTRMFAANLKNLGGTANDVYGWGELSDSGFYWDGVYFDNASDESNVGPEAMIILEGGLVRGSTGVLGIWNADSTKNKMNSHQKIFYEYITDYCNNGANFANGVPRITSANFGTWSANSTRNPITQWFNDSNAINLKLLEFSKMDGGYSSEAAYEGTTPQGYSTTQLIQLDSLAKANDFWMLFAGRIDYRDTTVASGWSTMKDAFLRSNFVRYKSILGHRALFAANPALAVSVPYMPCSSGGGTAYGGMIYGSTCNDRTEVNLYQSLTQLPFMNGYDLGQKNLDTGLVAMSTTDSAGVSVTVYRSYWVKANPTDTTYSFMYYFPRKTSSTEWRQSGLHAVRITPASSSFKRLEYDGSLTTISGASQLCWVGDQLILSYSTSAAPAPPSPAIMFSPNYLKDGVYIK